MKVDARQVWLEMKKDPSFSEGQHCVRSLPNALPAVYRLLSESDSVQDPARDLEQYAAEFPETPPDAYHTLVKLCASAYRIILQKSGPARPLIMKEITVTKHDDTIAEVSFTKNVLLDEQVLERIEQDLFSLVDKHNIRKIVLNFTTVDEMSTAILSRFLRLDKAIGYLVFYGIKRYVYEQFAITRLHEKFTIVRDRNTALDVLENFKKSKFAKV